MDSPISKSATICAIMKDEGPYIIEWIAFHKTLGFDVIKIYDNETCDGSQDILHALSRMGEIHYVFWPDKLGQSPQTSAYADAMKFITTEWVCFIDADEFINLHRHNTISDFISSFAPSVSAIALNWRIFGSAGLDEPGSGLVIERFTRASDISFHTNRHIKTIAKYSAIKEMHIHRCFLHSGNYVNVSGEPIEIIKMGFSPNVNFSSAQVNHYVVKSKSEYLLKKKRGNVNRAPESNEKYSKITEEFFKYHDRNEIYDGSILRFRSMVLTEMDRLNKLL